MGRNTGSYCYDWIKGQVTAIETGILQFDQVFLPYILTPSGQTVTELVESRKLLKLPRAEES